jgi:signal transduction histidine kinase
LSRGGPDAEPTEADLAEHVRAAVDGPVGRQLGIDFDVLGEPRAVPESVATAFAAVAREGLTNINKHAPGAAASATLLYSPDGVRLEMINGLRPPQRTEPGGESAARREPPTDDGLDDRTDLSVTGGGYGVAGMSRRMAEVGGRLETERIGDRWQLIADWPAPTAVQHVQADRRSERSGATGTEK